MKADALSERLTNVFTSQTDDVVSNGSCSWECRDVNDGYVTQIIGFDFKNGTTFCNVFLESDLNQDLGLNASRTNTACCIRHK